MGQVGELGAYKTPQEAANAAIIEYNKQLALGKEAEFKRIAGEEADRFQRENMVFAITDAIGLHGIVKGIGSTRNLLKEPLGLVKKLTAPTADNLLVQGTKEGIEEIGQNVMQYEAEYQTAKRTGSQEPIAGTSEDFTERMLQFITDENTLLQGAIS